MTKKKTSRATWIMTGVFVLIGWAIVDNYLNPAPPPQAKTQAEIIRDKQVDRAARAAAVIRDQLKDPDSFVMEKALVMQDGTGCYQYRAKNGFGGMEQGFAIVPGASDQLITSESDGFSDDWDSACANKQGLDITAAINSAVL